MGQSNFSGGYFNELQSRSQRTVAIESGFVLVINLVALVGNSVICVVMFRNPRLHSVPNFYILSLAIADIFMALIVMPFSFGVLVTSYWPFGAVICTIQGAVVLILAFVSSSTVALMAVNRYFRIVRSSSYRTLFTVNKATFMILAVWGLVILLVLLPVVCGWATIGFYPERANCLVKPASQNSNQIFTALHLILFVAIPMVVIIVCYLRIFIKVRRHSASVHPSLRSCGHQGVAEMTVEEIGITRLILSIVLGFVICWIPVLVIEFVNTSMTSPGTLPRWVYMLYKYLWYTSAAINPLIYGAFNRSFRKAARQTVTRSAIKRTGSLEHAF